MTLEDKFSQFNLTEKAIENFKNIAELHANKNLLGIPFTIETKIIVGLETTAPNKIK